MAKTTPAPGLEAYLADLDDEQRAAVRTLDAAIRKASSRFDVAVKYGILMYSLDGDWRVWVCAVDARKATVTLRFLYGVLLDDPLGVLRKGSSVLCNWDFPLGSSITSAAVTRYVKEAVRKKGAYVADQDAILAASRKPGRAASGR